MSDYTFPNKGETANKGEKSDEVRHAKLSVTFPMSEVRPVKAAENDDDMDSLVTTSDENTRSGWTSGGVSVDWK
jgi:hypothetical protein